MEPRPLWLGQGYYCSDPGLKSLGCRLDEQVTRQKALGCLCRLVHFSKTCHTCRVGGSKFTTSRYIWHAKVLTSNRVICNCNRLVWQLEP